MDAYCFKCKSQTEIQHIEQVTLKNGRPAMRGTCAKCDTKVFRMGSIK